MIKPVSNGLPEKEVVTERLQDLQFDSLLNSLQKKFPNIDRELLYTVYTFDKESQMRTYRESGERSISHPLGIAQILLENNLFDLINSDSNVCNDIFATVFLHDLVEDKYVFSNDDFGRLQGFGDVVTHAVLNLTKPINIEAGSFKDASEYKGYYDPKHAKKVALQVNQLDSKSISSSIGKPEKVDDDLKAKVLLVSHIVKAGDLIHNLRTVSGLGKSSSGEIDVRRRYIEETWKLWIPAFESWGYEQIADMIKEECRKAASGQGLTMEKVLTVDETDNLS